MATSYSQPGPLLTDEQLVHILRLADEYALAKMRSEKLRAQARRMEVPFSKLKEPVTRARSKLTNHLRGL